VRRLVVGAPQPGDAAIVLEEVDKILAGQTPDGSLADPENKGAIKATGNGLVKLLEMGCSPDEPRIKRAAAALEKAIDELPPDKWEETRGGALCALARLGRTDKPALKAAAKRAARDALQHPGCGCPWADQIHFMRIWAGRHAADSGGQIDKMAAWMEEAAQPPGCSAKIGLCHTWSLVKAIAVVDHPACRRVARNLVPMILRAQQPDGGWGDDEHSTFWVLTLLKKHGLFEQLRQLPPLPPDWRVVRSIPAPGKKPRALAWDGKRLWVHDGDKESPAAIAVSPQDGKVLKTVKLPRLKQCSPIGIWDGDLTLTTHGKDRTLFRIDVDTGEVVRRVSLRFLGDFLSTAAQMGDKLIIGDHWDSGISVLDVANPTRRIRHVRTPSGTPQAIAVAGDEFWLADIWAPSVVRTNLQGKRIEWAEKPFGSVGIAWDGIQLWALDPKKKRLCVVKRATKERRP